MPCISQVQQGAWFFKQAATLQKFPFAGDLQTSKEDYISSRRNWHEVEIPKGAKDSQGNLQFC